MKYFYFYSRKYSISEDGVVVRCEYKDVRIQKYNGKCVKLHRTNKERQLKPYTDKEGYQTITLACGDYSKTYCIHHLVYMVYILNKIYFTETTTLGYSFKNKNFIQINHIDGNKQNNDYKNLELVTLQENIQHAVKNKLHNSQKIAKYIDIYKNGKYVKTVWKFKGLAEFFEPIVGKLPNRGTLYSYLKKQKVYYGYTFQYKV